MQDTEIKQQITLRAARATDVEALYVLLLGYFTDLDLPYPHPDATDTRGWLTELVEANTVVVAECDGQLVGSVALEVCEFRWNRAHPYLFGHWLYVSESHREGGTGRKLIEAAKAIANLNLMLLMMGNIWGIDQRVFDRLMQMAGFVQAGNAYLYAPPVTKLQAVN